MRNIMSMRITVDKREMLEKLYANRDQHVKDFEEAFRGFQNLCVKTLRKRARAIASGKETSAPSSWMRFFLEPPSNHERDYTQVIEMLEMAQETEIEVDGAQFRQWVQDEWEWTKSFAGTKTLYTPHS